MQKIQLILVQWFQHNCVSVTVQRWTSCYAYTTKVANKSIEKRNIVEDTFLFITGGNYILLFLNTVYEYVEAFQ